MWDGPHGTDSGPDVAWRMGRLARRQRLRSVGIRFRSHVVFRIVLLWVESKRLCINVGSLISDYNVDKGLLHVHQKLGLNHLISHPHGCKNVLFSRQRVSSHDIAID